MFSKPYILKVCSFLIVSSLVACTPLSASADFPAFLAGLFGGQAQADEIIIPSDTNLQNMDLLATNSSDPDIKNADLPEEAIRMGWDSSYIESDGSLHQGIVVEKSPLSDQISVYTVKSGDTLSELAEGFDVSVNTLRWENKISGQAISIGQKLNILPTTGVKHIVKSGDTISKIANKYEAEAEDILIFNDIQKEDGLKVGQVLIVPNGIIKTVVVSNPKTGSSVSVSNTKVQSGYYIRPVPGRVTSPYGSRKGGFHPGVDLAGVKGVTSVGAAADGVIIEVVSGCKEGNKRCGGGYGNHIEIIHPNGTITRYAHLYNTSVSTGQTISQGEVIGVLGNSGSSTGPHLHFEIINANGSKMRPPF